MIHEFEHEFVTKGDESVNRIIEDFATCGHGATKVAAAGEISSIHEEPNTEGQRGNTEDSEEFLSGNLS